MPEPPVPADDDAQNNTADQRQAEADREVCPAVRQIGQQIPLRQRIPRTASQWPTVR